jgi:hypothetical protein
MRCRMSKTGAKFYQKKKYKKFFYTRASNGRRSGRGSSDQTDMRRTAASKEGRLILNTMLLFNTMLII